MSVPTWRSESEEGDLRAFAVKLLHELYLALNLPVDYREYKPSSYLYVRRRGWREEEGVFRKGEKLSKDVKIARVDFHEGVGEVEAEVPSEGGGQKYKVKVYLPLDFECTCPWGATRFNPCKHVFAAVLKILEDMRGFVDIITFRTLVYEGLNRVAYHKAQASRSIA